MLDQLKALHDDIVMFIGELEKLTAAPIPKLDAVADTRLRLTRASRRRTTLLETQIYPHLLDRVPPADRQRVESLRNSGKARLQASVGHIGQWTLQEVRDRWSDYGRASRAMRASMRERVEEERAIIYPLLTR
jgi:hypothetical protein